MYEGRDGCDKCVEIPIIDFDGAFGGKSQVKNSYVRIKSILHNLHEKT